MRRNRNDELRVRMQGVKAEAQAILEIVRALNRLKWDGERKRVLVYCAKHVGIESDELQGSVERRAKEAKAPL